jgi:hypothetical protein
VYNPFPLEEVLTTRLSGTIKLGVGREVAVDEDTNTFGFCNNFFRRCKSQTKKVYGVAFSESCHVGCCDLIAERTFGRPRDGDCSRISVAKARISGSAGEYGASAEAIVSKLRAR